MDNWPTAEMIAEYEAEQRNLKRINNPDPIEHAIMQDTLMLALLLEGTEPHTKEDK